MTTVRTPIRRGLKSKITPEVLEAYRVARKLYDESDLDEFGCRSDQCNKALTELHDLLGRTCCDIDVIADTIDYVEGWGSIEEFEEASAIRIELERLA